MVKYSMNISYCQMCWYTKIIKNSFPQFHIDLWFGVVRKNMDAFSKKLKKVMCFFE